METHGEKTSLLLVTFEGVCLTQPSGIFENCTTKIVDLKSKKQNELRIFWMYSFSHNMEEKNTVIVFKR